LPRRRSFYKYWQRKISPCMGIRTGGPACVLRV
jgi:hypothetical protein